MNHTNYNECELSRSKYFSFVDSPVHNKITRIISVGTGSKICTICNSIRVVDVSTVRRRTVRRHKNRRSVGVLGGARTVGVERLR